MLCTLKQEKREMKMRKREGMMMMIIVCSDIYKYFFASLLCVCQTRINPWRKSDLQSPSATKVVMVEPLFCYYYIEKREKRKERNRKKRIVLLK